MNDETDISKYLENKVSRDLQLKYGYFAVRNRNSKEKEIIRKAGDAMQNALSFLANMSQ